MNTMERSVGGIAAPTHIHLATRNRVAPVPYRVAVLGTGKMGSAIAARLSDAGHEIVLWNRTRSRAEALGIGTVAETPAAAAREADLVISSLTGPEAVRAAYLGPDGALMARPGIHFVEMSTAGPDVVADLAAQVSAADGTLVVAPILGAPPIVRAGEAAILAGGDASDVALASPVLSLLGTVRHVGPLGAAARLKLVANTMLADVTLAAAELQVAGERAGLDPDAVFWVLQRFVPALEARRAGYLDGRHAPSMFALRDLRKDLGLATDLFDRSGANTPLARASAGLVTDAAGLTPDLDISAVVQLYRNPADRLAPSASGAVAAAPIQP